MEAFSEWQIFKKEIDFCLFTFITWSPKAITLWILSYRTNCAYLVACLDLEITFLLLFLQTILQISYFITYYTDPIKKHFLLQLLAKHNAVRKSHGLVVSTKTYSKVIKVLFKQILCSEYLQATNWLCSDFEQYVREYF